MSTTTDKTTAAAAMDAPTAPGVIPAGFEDNFGWLLAQCFRAHVEAMDFAVADLPHGHRGFQALLGAANCSAHNQAELAKQLGVDRTVMVYLVDDLEHAGLVERLPDPNDRRSRLIRATEAGRERLSVAQSRISAAEAHLLGALSAKQQQSLRSMLREVAAHRMNPATGAEACSIADRVNQGTV
ncbi:MAG: MarR family winged helix-turn-helix transcriptional regulator [Actinocrinis sp.]